MPPALQAATAPGGVTVAWPLRSTPFVLECASNLNSGTAWAVVTNQAALSNRFWQVALPFQSASQSFYRLRAP